MGRSAAKTGRPARPEDLGPSKNNERLAADFVSPWPTSRFGSTQLRVMSDEYSRWIGRYATVTRDCCCQYLDQWVRDHGRPDKARSDNAKEFRELNSE